MAMLKISGKHNLSDIEAKTLLKRVKDKVGGNISQSLGMQIELKGKIVTGDYSKNRGEFYIKSIEKPAKPQLD
jgi:hypothetical protein